MRWYVGGKIGQQMEDYMDGDYDKNDETILELAMTEGMDAFQELITEHETAIRGILDNEDRDLNEICDLDQVASYLVKAYQWKRILENEINKQKKFLKKNKKK